MKHSYQSYSVALKSVVSGPAASPRTLLEMQILSSYLKPTASDILGLRPWKLCFNNPSRGW